MGLGEGRRQCGPIVVRIQRLPQFIGFKSQLDGFISIRLLLLFFIEGPGIPDRLDLPAIIIVPHHDHIPGVQAMLELHMPGDFVGIVAAVALPILRISQQRQHLSIGQHQRLHLRLLASFLLGRKKNRGVEFQHFRRIQIHQRLRQPLLLLLIFVKGDIPGVFIGIVLVGSG